MNFNLNLATRVYVDFRKVNLLLAVLFIVLVTWLSFCIYTFTSNYHEISRFTENKAKAQTTSSVKIPDSEYAKLLSNIKAANTILTKRSYNWLSLLDNLEEVIPSGISLRGLEPVNKGESIKLVGVAINFNAVRKFMENLESSKKFTEIFLTEQSTIKSGNHTLGIQFSVTCKALI